MLKRRFSIPEPSSRVLKLCEQLDILTPRQPYNDPLDEFRVRPGFRAGAPIKQVRARKAARSLKLGAEVDG